MARPVSGADLARWTAGGLVVLALLAGGLTTTVRQGQAGLHLRLGRLIAVREQPGWVWKAPWPLDEVIKVDVREHLLTARATELLTRDRRNVVLQAHARWRIADPRLFFESCGEQAEAERKLDGLLANAQIHVLGRYDLAALVSVDPSTLKSEAIEQDLLDAVAPVAREKYGLEVAAVALERMALPEANLNHVFDQMRAERREQAERFRAQGALEAARIRADAEQEAAEILAQADAEAAQLLADAEAEAALAYAAAAARDPVLARTLSELQTLERALGPESTVLLRTDAAPFQLLIEAPR